MQLVVSNSVEQGRRSAKGFATIAIIAMTAISIAFPLMAQEKPPEPYTFVAEWTVPRDQWASFAEHMNKNVKPIFERMGSDGTLIDWGMYETLVHEETKNTHGIWWSAKTFANLEKARLEAIKLPPHPAMVTAPHRDYLLRSMFGASRTGAGAGGYVYVNTQHVRAGMEARWKEMWEKVNKPVLDDLVAKGQLLAYWVQYEDVHTAPNSLRFIVTISASADAEDKINAAFDAARAKRSDLENQGLGSIMRELAVPEDHRDYMARITGAWFK